MASSFSDLGLELMATGENAGTWGTKTNTNLQIIEKSIAGYVEQAVTSGGTTALSITDGDTTESTSVARHAVIKLTGTITGNSIVTVPDSIEKVYIVTNGTSGAYTVQFKTASGTGITFGVSEKTTRLVYSDGTNIVDAGFGGASDMEGRELVLDADGDTTITADTDDQIDIKIAGADDFQFTANTFTAQSGSTIAAQALTATTVTASGIVKTDDTTEATSTTDGSLQTDGGLSVAKDAVFGDDVKLLSDSAVLNFGADSDVSLTHVADTALLLNAAMRLQFRDSGLYIGSNADGDLDIVSDGTAVDSINLESAGGITLDAGTAGSGIIYEDDGTEMARIHNSSSDVILETKVSDKDFLVKGNDGGSTITALTFDMSAAGKATFNNEIVSGAVITSGAGLVIADGGNIGSASDTDAMAISSGGVVTFSQNPVFPDGSVDVADIDLDGATDIGAAIADADLFLVDDGAGGTMRKATASRIKTYMGAATGEFSVANLDIDGATDIGAAIVDADLFIIDDGAGGTNRKVTASRLKTYAQTGVSSAADDITAGDAAVTISTSSGNITIDTAAGDADIIFKGTDSSSDITAATFDMSDGGALLLEGGSIDLKNRGSVSNIKFYCESSNAHYAQLQSAAHSAYSGNITLTLPASTDTLVGKATTDTLTNKTLTTPIIAEIDSGSTITLDATTDITLDADGGDIFFKDGGTTIATFTNSSTDFIVESATSDKDIIFKVNDGGSSTEVARFDGDVSAFKMASGKQLQLGAAEEHISGDGTDITFAVGSGGDINIGSGIGLTFGDDGEKIEGDGTDLTVASSAKINLTATSDIHVPNDVGIVFGGDSEKIEGDGTDLVISANNLTIDAAADIILDAAGNDFNFKAGGTEVLRITNSSSDVIIRPVVDAKDLIFQQRDGTEVARIEDNGTFNVVTSKLAINGTAVTSTAAELNLLDGVSGLVQADLTKLAAVDSTAAELNIVDGGTSATSTTVADADRVVLNDNGTMVQVAMTDIKTYIGGGTSWQAVKTSNFTASAGQGIFANTTSASFTVTLPASPDLGDEVSIKDYAGTFDTNALTVGRNSQPIEGVAADLTVSVERAGFTLVYSDSTQGWLLKDK
jgi:hypothetical protein